MASKLSGGSSTRKRLQDKVRRSTFKSARHVDAIRGTVESPVTEYPILERVNYYDDYCTPKERYSPTHSGDFVSPGSRHLRETVTLESVLSNMKKGHTTFIGPAGTGKTTLLRSIARRASMKECPGLQDVEFVHFIDGRTLGYQGKLTPSQFLLFDILPGLDEFEKMEYDKIWNRAPSKFLLILDSLDTLPFTLEDEREVINFVDEARVSTVVWNFLTNRIARGCRIITSSREHGIRGFRGDLRPKSVIALAGLATASIEKISKDYLGQEQAIGTLKRLKELSPAVIKLCSTPVFLALTLHGISCDQNFRGNSMTAVLCEVFCCLMRSSVSQTGNTELVVLKLAHFAYDGIRRGKVVFDISELLRFGLKESDVVDLAIIAPRGGTQKLLQVENCLYFSHLCLQEMLSALHISRSPLEEFREFLLTKIHAPRFSVIRRLLAGLLYDKDILRLMENSFGAIPCVSEKRQLFEQSLKERLKQTTVPVDLLEQLITLNEGLPALEKVVSSTLNEIILHGIALSTSDAFVIGSIVSVSGKLALFAMIDCNLSAEVLKAISTPLSQGTVQISRFQVSDNKNMGVEGVLEFAGISKSCSVNFLDMGNCALTPDSLRALREGLRDTQVGSMLLRENKNIGKEGYSILGEIIDGCGVQKLGLGGCDLTAVEYRALWTSMKHAVLMSLVLSSIIPHTPPSNEIQAVADMVRNVAGELRLIGWVINEESRRLLQKNIREFQPDLKIILDDDDILTSKTVVDQTIPGLLSAKKNSIAKTDIRKIGPEGGIIKIGKCEVHYPVGAVNPPTRFRISLGSHKIPLSDDNVLISSCLSCQPSMKFPVPVKIKLPTWCYTSSNDVPAYIMGQDSNEEDPYLVGKVPLRGTSGIIEFETSHFSNFWSFIKRILFGEVKFKVTPTLHFHPSTANFTTSFHVMDQIVAEVCSKQLKDGGFEMCPVMLDTVTLKPGDAVGTMLRCLDPNTHEFDEEDLEMFEVTEDFASYSAKYIASVLTPKPTPGQELMLSVRITPYEVRDRRFRLVWPEEERRNEGVQIFGDVNAENIVF